MISGLLPMAKANLGESIDRAQEGGPKIITRNG
ncbi:MAG: type II toxin-antitoxin system prevent-host-death family antitoxin [Steroidobacter sp.]|nr:type II toxin-antitoxin system prevent-host-death family antitoxin [Steroidobacter sp.]